MRKILRPLFFVGADLRCGGNFDRTICRQELGLRTGMVFDHRLHQQRVPDPRDAAFLALRSADFLDLRTQEVEPFGIVGDQLRSAVFVVALLLLSWLGSIEAGAQVPPGGTIVLGEQSPLGYLDSGNANLLPAQGPYMLAQAGIIQSLSFWVVTPAGQLLLGLYDAGPNKDCRGGNLIGQTNAFKPTQKSWNTHPVVSKVSVPVGWYCLAYLASDNGLSFRKGYNGVPEVNYPWDFSQGLPSQFAANPSGGDGAHWMFYASLIAGSAAQPVISFDPPSPSIAATAVTGDLVAKVNVTMSDGSAFSGSLAFGSPYTDDNGTFTLSGNQILVASAAKLSAEGGSTQNITVVATQ
jgi:hypothetical protein